MVRKGPQCLPNGELCIQIAIKSGSFGLDWFTVSGTMGRQWEETLLAPKSSSASQEPCL